MMLDELQLLLVEDNPGDVRLFREMLRTLGYPTHTLAVGGTVDEALRLLTTNTFDALMLDLGLPDSQGLETLALVQASARDIPTIVLTGLNDHDVGMQAVQRGAQDYLVKDDVYADMLARTIRYAVGRHQALSEAKREAARAAAAEERLRATQESRAALEHEVAQRRQAQSALERSLERIRALRAIDSAIIANHTLTPMMDVALAQTVQQLNVDAGDVLLREPDGTLRMAASVAGLPEAFDPGRSVPDDDPAVVHALRAGIATLNVDTANMPTFARFEPMKRAGFRTYHAVRLSIRDRFLGILELYSRSAAPPGEEWTSFCETLAGQTAMAVDSAQLQENLHVAHRRLTAAYDETIEGWARALDLRDKETEGHSRRVTQLSVYLAHRLGIDGADLTHLTRGSLLHDIGKMGVPDAVLQKPGSLDDNEWAIMRQHTTFARDLLEPIEFLRPAITIPYSHHEKWDGSGYPRGLQGHDIPLPARIFALADVYDALTNDRPYRRAWTGERALEHIRTQAGRHFDPDLVPHFLGILANRAPTPKT